MNYDFEKAYNYAVHVSVDDLFKRCISYNAYIGNYYQCNSETVGDDIVLSILGSLYGPVGNLTEEEISEMDKFLSFINRGYNTYNEKWGGKLEVWLNHNAKTQRDVMYFEKMWDALLAKCDGVYDLLCSHYHISSMEILKELLNPLAKFDGNQSIYQKWIYE